MNKLFNSPTFYTVIEYATYAVFLTGWALCIIYHL